MDKIKGFVSSFQHEIPDDMRFIFEDVSYQHSIHYADLDTFHYLISIWDDDICLSWDETLIYADMFGLKPVPIIYEGVFDEKLMMDLAKNLKADEEGYVIRLRKSFSYFDFKKSIAKFVSDNFKIGDQHWSSGLLTPNKLK